LNITKDLNVDLLKELKDSDFKFDMKPSVVSSAQDAGD